jgi:hypothetical protein
LPAIIDLAVESDACGPAQLARAGLFKAVHVKSLLAGR